MPSVTTEHIAIGCNRTLHAAAWNGQGLVAFGANRLIALYNPLVSPCFRTLFFFGLTQEIYV